MTALYHALLGRAPDASGLSYYTELLDSSKNIAEIVRSLISSDEYRKSASSPNSDRAWTVNENDSVIKWMKCEKDAWAYICLPLITSDPIVIDYLNGRTPNEYMLEILNELTTDGDTVIDLGCHVGTFSVGAAAIGRRVIAVDANASHIKLMTISKLVNGFDNLELHHVAISGVCGIVPFTENGLFGAIDYSATDKDAAQVPSCGLDDIIVHEEGPIRFVKMDIEGAEFDALMTGQRLLRRDKPAILFESNGPTLMKGGHSIDELRRLFETLGYRVFRHEHERWVYAPPGQVQPEAWVDMVALHEDDQKRVADKIDLQWGCQDILLKCTEWAQLPYANTRKHLESELARYEYDDSLNGQFRELMRKLQSGFYFGSLENSPDDTPKS